MEVVGSGGGGGGRCICEMGGNSGCNFMNDRLVGIPLPFSYVISHSIESHVR